MSTQEDEGEFEKLMWKKLGGHMIDSGEITEEEAKAIFTEIVDEARKDVLARAKSQEEITDEECIIHAE